MNSQNRFTQSELNEFYANLERKLVDLRRAENLRQEIERTDLSPEAFGERAPTRFHQADQANQAEEQEMMSDIVGRNIREIEEMEDGLRRIEKGEFGYCETCHKEISSLRLKEVPEARYCQTCEIDEEKVQRLGRHRAFKNRADFNVKDLE